MKTLIQFSNKRTCAILLFGAVTLFSSCSKEEASPTKALDSKSQSVNESQNGVFEFNYGSPVYSGTGQPYSGLDTRIAFDTGALYSYSLNGHTELAQFCSMEFHNQSGIALVVRHVGIHYGSTANYGNGIIEYCIPAQLEPGNYQITLRTEDDNQSLAIGTTGNPSTYTHVVTDLGSVDIKRTLSPRLQFYSDRANLYPVPLPTYFSNYTLVYTTTNFPNNNAMRAFAKNQSTGIIYQLTPASGPIPGGVYMSATYSGPVGVFTYNDTSNSVGQVPVTLNENGQPQFLPNGPYIFFVDDFSNRYAGGGNYINVGTGGGGSSGGGGSI